MATTPHSSCSLSSVARSVVSCMATTFEPMTLSSRPEDSLTLVIPTEDFSPSGGTCCSPELQARLALLQSSRHQALFRLHVQSTLQRDCPRLSQLRHSSRRGNHAVHAD